MNTTLEAVTPRTHPKIVRILSVEDTRTWDEGPDDHWYPIAGSGTQSTCARCGRTHEILATVELEDKSTVVVGTGCARADDLIDGARFRSAASAAKRIKELRAHVAKAERDAAIVAEAWRKVDAMTIPEPVWGPPGQFGFRSTAALAVSVGDSVALASAVREVTNPNDHALRHYMEREKAERIECARRAWKRNRVNELLAGTGLDAWLTDYPLAELRRKLAKAEAKAAR